MSFDSDVQNVELEDLDVQSTSFGQRVETEYIVVPPAVEFHRRKDEDGFESWVVGLVRDAVDEPPGLLTEWVVDESNDWPEIRATFVKRMETDDRMPPAMNDLTGVMDTFEMEIGSSFEARGSDDSRFEGMETESVDFEVPDEVEYIRVDDGNFFEEAFTGSSDDHSCSFSMEMEIDDLHDSLMYGMMEEVGHGVSKPERNSLYGAETFGRSRVADAVNERSQRFIEQMSAVEDMNEMFNSGGSVLGPGNPMMLDIDHYDPEDRVSVDDLAECPVDGCFERIEPDERDVREHCLDKHGWWTEDLASEVSGL